LASPLAFIAPSPSVSSGGPENPKAA